MCLGLCASAVCCAGASVCGCCSNAFGSCGVKSRSMPRLSYVMLQVVSVLVAFTFMYTLKPLTDGNGQFITCAGDSTEEGAATACFGTSAVLRMTFTLLVFQVFILLLILPRNDCASVIHDGGWTLKYILVFGGFTAMFWVPMGFF